MANLPVWWTVAGLFAWDPAIRITEDASLMKLSVLVRESETARVPPALVLVAFSSSVPRRNRLRCLPWFVLCWGGDVIKASLKDLTSGASKLEHLLYPKVRWVRKLG